MLDLRKIDLRKLNSMTKYPSIPTYHTLGERGALTEDAIAFTGRVIGREKIDGTNARMVFVGDGRYLLGSREEFLYARGDLIGNPALGIVDALRETADAFTAASPADGALLVCYGEIYGGNVTAGSKQYTGEKRVGFRVFDVATIPNVTELLKFAPERIAAWREDGGQTFHAEEDLRAFSRLRRRRNRDRTQHRRRVRLSRPHDREKQLCPRRQGRRPAGRHRRPHARPAADREASLRGLREDHPPQEKAVTPLAVAFIVVSRDQGVDSRE